MTITKRDLLKALEQVDDLDVIYCDNGLECIEFRAVTVMRPADGGAYARRDLYESVSPMENTDGEMMPDDGSVILRLAN